MKIRVTGIMTIGLAGLMLMALVGCSSSDAAAPAQPVAPAAAAAAAPAQAGSSSGYVPAAPSQPAAPAAAAAAPSAEVEATKKVSAKPKQTVAKTVTEFEGGTRGGVMKINTQKWFQRWDMTTRSHWSSTQGLNRHYSGVLQFSPRDGLTVTPDLAKSWTLTDDLTGSTFVFNEGVKWHDGEDFSVDDVIYTINRWQNPPVGVAQPRVAGLLLVDSMLKVGDNTLQIAHTKPTSRILPAMADSWHIILPQHILEPAGGVLSTGDQVIGTGPFKVESFSEGNNVVSVANPYYFHNAPDGSPFPYLDGITGIALAFWIIFNNLIILFKKISIKNNFKKFTQNIVPNYSNGMIVAHLGIGCLILGITSSSVWQEEKITRMKIGNETNIREYNIILKEINEIKGPNYLALQGNFLVYDKEKNIITILKPENRFYPITNNFTTEASIHTNLLRDLYIVLGEGNVNDGWVVRIYYNPLVMWIWIGALTIFLGGIVSMNSNLKKLKRLS